MTRHAYLFITREKHPAKKTDGIVRIKICRLPDPKRQRSASTSVTPRLPPRGGPGARQRMGRECAAGAGRGGPRSAPGECVVLACSGRARPRGSARPSGSAAWRPRRAETGCVHLPSRPHGAFSGRCGGCAP